MNDLCNRLKSADPVVDEGPLSDIEAQRMRRAIVDAGRERTSGGAIAWKTSWAVLTLVVAGSVVFEIARWREPRVDAPAAATPETPRATSEPRRQVHFVAPGG